VTRDPRSTAEACFALARSSTFAGEREAAIARGIAIAEGAGLSLDGFDIPGRTRPKKPPPSRFREDLFARPRSPFYGGNPTQEDLDDVLGTFYARMEATLRAMRKDTLAKAVAAQAEQVRRERERRGKVAENTLRLALNFLWSRDVRVYQTADGLDGSPRYVMPHETGLEFDADGVIEVATRRGFVG
jgi:hypothetical protein